MPIAPRYRPRVGKMNSNHKCAINGLFLFWIFFSSPLVYAWSIVIPEISGKYSAKILMDRCDKYGCEGPADIALFHLSTQKKVADFHSEDFVIGASSNPNPDEDRVANETSGDVVVGDFNFDGHDDIAIQNGHNGSYGYASYDVYTYDVASQAYILDANLTRLTWGEYLGMFRVDKKRKRLLTLNKAADRAMFSFEFISDIRGVKKVCGKEEIWDMSHNIVNVTVKTLQKDGWRIRQKIFSGTQYDFNKMAKWGRCSFIDQ